MSKVHPISEGADGGTNSAGSSVHVSTNSVNIRKMLSSNEDVMSENLKKMTRRKSLTTNLTSMATITNAEAGTLTNQGSMSEEDSLVLLILNHVAGTLSELRKRDEIAWKEFGIVTKSVWKRIHLSQTSQLETGLLKLLLEYKYDGDSGWPLDIVDIDKFYNELSNLYLSEQSSVEEEGETGGLTVKNIESLSFCPNVLFSNFPPDFGSKPCVSVFDGAVLLADISGFSKFAGEMCIRGAKGLDVLHKVTSGFLGHFVQTVYDHDGDVIAFAGDALVCVFPAGELSRSDDDIRTNRSLDEACGQALQCAYTLRTLKMHSLSAHFAVSCGPIQLALLGGVNDEWTFLMNGPCISELTLCIDNAPPQSVACTKICLECALCARPQINATAVANGMAFLINELAAAAASPSTKQAAVSGKIGSRIASLSTKGTQGQLLVSVPSHSMPLSTSSSVPTSSIDRQLSGGSGGAFSRSASAEVPSNGILSDGKSSVESIRGMNQSQYQGDPKGYVEKMIKKAAYFVPKPVLSSLNAGTLRSIAELRTITTMFINLDSYSLKDNMDPISLQPFFVLLQQILSKSGGFLRQFLIDDKGCVAIAMWGVPTYNHTNNAYRGLYCAWNVHTRVGELNHRVSIGLTTGPAYCGIVGSNLRRDYAGIGDKVNIAARLMAKAKGRVLIDPDVYLALDSTEKKHLIPFQELQLKGMKAPITPFMFAEEADLSEFRDQDTDHHSNTVIRQEVLQKLLAVLDQSIRGTPFLSKLKLDPNANNSDLKSAILIDPTNANANGNNGNNSNTNSSAAMNDDTSGGCGGGSEKLNVDKFDDQLGIGINNESIGVLSKKGTMRNSVSRIGSMFGMNSTSATEAENSVSLLGSRRRSAAVLTISTDLSNSNSNNNSNNNSNTNSTSEKKSNRRASLFSRGESDESSNTTLVTPKGGPKFSSNKYSLAAGGKMSSNKQQTVYTGRTASEHNAFLVLYGISGTGKSTALQFFKASAVRRKLRFVHMMCPPEGESVAFSTIKRVFWEIAGRNKYNSNILKRQLIADLLTQTRAEDGVKYMASSETELVFQELLLDKDKAKSDDDLLSNFLVEDETLDRRLDNKYSATKSRVSNIPLHAIADHEEDDLDVSVDHIGLAATGRKASDLDDMSSASATNGTSTAPGAAVAMAARLKDKHNSNSNLLAKADMDELSYLLALMLELHLSNFPAATVLAIEDAHNCDEQSLSLISYLQNHKMKLVVIMTLLQPTLSASSLSRASTMMTSSKIGSSIDSTVGNNTVVAVNSSDSKEDFRVFGSATVEQYIATRTLQITDRVLSGKAAASMNTKTGKTGQAVFSSASYLRILDSAGTTAIEMKPLSIPEIAIVLDVLFNNNKRELSDTPLLISNKATQARATQAPPTPTSTPAIGKAESIPPHLVQKVFDMTSGNAIWVKVIGRFIKEFGVQDFIATTEKGSSADCLKNLIICRLEKLSIEQQVVLKHASVLGMQFSVRSLAAVVPDAALLKLADTISVLNELGFIQCVEESPLAIYGFQHRLTRDTVYGMLPHSDATEIHLAATNYLEAKYAGSLQPFYQSLGYHYCNARGHHELAFKFTLKAADWSMRKQNYETGLENLRIAFNIARSTVEINIVLEVLNRTIRELSKKSAASPHRLKQSGKQSSTAGALILGLSGKKGTVGIDSGDNNNYDDSVAAEDIYAVLLRKHRELKNEIDNQLLATESVLAAQRLMSITSEINAEGGPPSFSSGASPPPRGFTGIGKKQMSFVSGFGEADNSQLAGPGQLKWQLSFGGTDLSKMQRQSSVSSIASNNNNSASTSNKGGGLLGLLNITSARSAKGAASSKGTASSKQNMSSARGSEVGTGGVFIESLKLGGAPGASPAANLQAGNDLISNSAKRKPTTDPSLTANAIDANTNCFGWTCSIS